MTDIISAEVMTKRSICTIDLTEAFKTVNECIAPKFGDTLEFLMADVKDWYKFQSALSRYAENGNDIIYRVGVVERANDCRVKATKIIYEIAETLLEQAAAKIALNIDGCLAQIFGINLINLQIPTPCLRVEPRKAVLAKLPNSKNLKHDEPQIGGELAQAPNNGVMANDTKSDDSPSIFNPIPDTSEVSNTQLSMNVSGGTSNLKSQCEPIPSMACTDGLLTSTETPSGNEEAQAINSASDDVSVAKEQTEDKDNVLVKLNFNITPTEAFIGVPGDNSYFTNPFNWSRAFSQSKWEKTPDDNINEFKVQIADYANRLTPSGALSRLSCINMAHNTPEFMAYQKSAQKLLGNYSQAFTEILESENSSTLITNSDAERTAIKTFALDRTISLRFLMRIAKLAQLRLAPYGDNHYGDCEHGKKCLKAIEVEKLSILNDEEWVEHQKTILLSYLNDTLSLWWEHLQLGRPLEQPPVVLNSNNEALNA